MRARALKKYWADYGPLESAIDERVARNIAKYSRSPFKFATIAAGVLHSLFLTDGGAVFSCGNGEDGQLGHGDEKDRLTTKRIAALGGRRVVQVAAGEHHSLFLTEDGGVLGAGARRPGEAARAQANRRPEGPARRAGRGR